MENCLHNPSPMVYETLCGAYAGRGTLLYPLLATWTDGLPGAGRLLCTKKCLEQPAVTRLHKKAAGRPRLVRQAPAEHREARRGRHVQDKADKVGGDEREGPAGRRHARGQRRRERQPQRQRRECAILGRPRLPLEQPAAQGLSSLLVVASLARPLAAVQQGDSLPCRAQLVSRCCLSRTVTGGTAPRQQGGCAARTCCGTAGCSPQGAAPRG